MHIRVHTGEEPFICPYCGKGHKQKGQLKVHITKHHPQVQNAFEALSLRRDSNSSSSKLILTPVRQIIPFGTILDVWSAFFHYLSSRGLKYFKWQENYFSTPCGLSLAVLYLKRVSQECD